MKPHKFVAAQRGQFAVLTMFCEYCGLETNGRQVAEGCPCAPEPVTHTCTFQGLDIERLNKLIREDSE